MKNIDERYTRDMVGAVKCSRDQIRLGEMLHSAFGSRGGEHSNYWVDVAFYILDNQAPIATIIPRGVKSWYGQHAPCF